MKPKKHLGFNGMRTMLSSCFNQIPEHRQSNKITYSAHDALMSGFACMHFQDPSLLQFQKRLEKKHHKSNLQTLFDIKSIPESTQLRTIIDGVDSDYFGSFFDDYTHYLQRGKHLAQYQLLDGLYYIPMDATDYFSSYACFCDRCLRTKSKKKPVRDISVEPTMDELEELYSGEESSGVRYSHKALQIAIMHPDMKQVIPLMPEEIRNTDGANKQDCEMNAGKRLIPKLRKAHPQLGIILGGDDLFSRQPIIEDTLAARMHYLFVAKPESHVYLMDWLHAYPQLNQYETTDPKKLNVRYVYQWMNHVPLHGGEKAIRVNYLDVKVYSTGKNGKEKRTYHNSWVTDIDWSLDKTA